MRRLVVATAVVAAVLAVSGRGPAGAQVSCPAQTLAIPLTAATPNMVLAVGVAVDGAGNIYGVDGVIAHLYRFDASGAQTLVIPPTAANPNLISPFGVAVDGAGNIYTADLDTDHVYRFDSSGAQTVAIMPTAATPNFQSPRGGGG